MADPDDFDTWLDRLSWQGWLALMLTIVAVLAGLCLWAVLA